MTEPVQQRHPLLMFGQPEAVGRACGPAAQYCLHALAAASGLRSKAAVRRLIAVTLTALRPYGIPPCRIVQAIRRDDDSAMKAREYTVKGMTCSHCVASVRDEVSEVAGVAGV